AADELSPTSYLGPKAISNLFQGGKVTSGLSSLRLAEGSCDGGGEDQGDNCDAGGEDIARSLTTSESVHAGIGARAGMEILAVVRYGGCGGGVAAD
nr:hypothetical protein [Tanacetum cinerariifolium]